MNSKTRTQILYDNPNSMFKANKRVYMHELQGATLKTKKPTPDEITSGLKTSEQMSLLISNLEKIKTIVDYFYGAVFDIEGFRNIGASSAGVFIRDGINTIQKTRKIIKMMGKFPQTTFNEDDVFAIVNIIDDIYRTHEYTANRLHEAPMIFESYFGGTLFKKYIDQLALLIIDFQQLLPYVDISGKIQSMNVQTIEHPQAEADFQDAQEGPPPDDDPLNLDPAPAPLYGAGKFNKVLSSRIKQIQRHPYKRFL